MRALIPGPLKDHVVHTFEGRVAGILITGPTTVEHTLSEEFIGEDRAVPHEVIHAVFALAGLQDPVSSSRVERGGMEEFGVNVSAAVERAVVATRPPIVVNDAG